MIDPKLQILIENINVDCRYLGTDRECRRHSIQIKGRFGDFPEDVYTNCEGKILRCERTIEQLLAEKPPYLG